MSTYEICKKLIDRGRYEKKSMINKLDIFLLGDRLTEDQYKELNILLNQEAV